MDYPESKLHLSKWNKEFRDYINSRPKEIESYTQRANRVDGRPVVNIKFRNLSYGIDYFLYFCDCCKEPLAWRVGYDRRQKVRCATCRVEVVKANSRKTSRTYRKKHNSKTRLEIPCKQCNQLFNPFRSTRLYCSNKCRQRSYRAK